jgi:hypothetical protein
MVSMAMGTGSQSSSLREMSTFYLAIIVIGLFFSFYGVTLFVGVFPPLPRDYSGIERVSSTLGPIVATIIGFYFGQRPVQSLTGQIREGAVREERAKASFGSSYEQIGIDNDQIQDLMDQLRTKDRIIERLIGEIGER